MADVRRPQPVQRDHRTAGPGFTFAPPLVNDTIVTERVLGAYLETEFKGSIAGRPISIVAGVRFEDTPPTSTGWPPPIPRW
jgi:hypothetical protein